MSRGILKWKNKNITIQKKVMTIMALLFLFMFAILYFVFYTSMQKMLWERENDNIKNQAQLAENILTTSVEYLPNVTRDWAAWEGAYHFVLGEFDEFIDYYLTDYPYQIYNLDFISVLDLSGDIIYEKSYDHTNKRQQIMPMDLSEIYSKLGPLTAATFDENNEREMMTDAVKIGISGFIRTNGILYYLSSYPILNEDKTGPCVGSLVFGRIIHETEILYLTNNPEVKFSILNKQNLALSNDQINFLNTGKTLVIMTNNDEMAAYDLFDDIFGNNNLLLSITSPRYLYMEGIQFIMTILAVIALCCATMLFIVIKLLGHVIVKPLASLVDEVNRINFESVSSTPITKYENKEFNFLAEAVSNMYTRIETDRNIIKENNDKLYYNANFDTLTGLRNWNNAGNALNELIVTAKSNLSLVGVFLIDLDRFKFINDTLGHSIGNEFIISIAQRLKRELRQEPIIGRISGDEFVIIIGGLDEKHKIHIYADEILSLFKRPFTVNDREICISASLGSSTYPYNGQDIETLFKNAEIAMYRAKELGGNMYCKYESKLNKVLQRKLYVENKIRSAINDECAEFRAYFQPKALSETGEIIGCEALIRWMTPEGIIGPNEFIPLAEESGLIIPLSKWMLKESCRCNKFFETQGIYNTVSVNISAQVLLHKGFLNMIKEAVEETGMDIKRLDIEITEATLVDDVVKVNKILKALHEMGITISIDDFGTGYSCLSYLKELSVDRIKIDRSFVMDINRSDGGDMTIVNAIVAMGKSLHMLITAEGVEDAIQYAYLKSINCEEIQGYYISKPLAHEEYTTFCKNWISDREVL